MQTLSSIRWDQKIPQPTDAPNTWWSQRFADVFGRSCGERYATIFAEHCISPFSPDKLTDAQFCEMKIPIGHRKIITMIMERIWHAHNGGEFEAPPMMDASSSNVLKSRHSIDNLENSLEHTVMICKATSLRWVDFEGQAGTYDDFLKFVHTACLNQGTEDELPEHFLRAFYDNTPMPFSSKSHTKSGRICAVLLLRNPTPDITQDPLSVRESTVATMTNRFVVLYVPRGGRGGTIITYHKDPTSDLPWLKDMKTDGWERLEKMSRERLLLHIVQEAVKPSRAVLESYRRQLDVLIEMKISRSPSAVVEWMSKIARQSQVLKRCLSGNLHAARELQNGLGLDGGSTVQVLSDMAQAAEEIEGNALDAVNLRMGLIGFRAQENMKLFTYISAVTAPLAVMTGWYGMNFDAMPDLHYEESYYVFIALAGFVAFSMVILLKWKHSDQRTVDETLIQDIRQGLRIEDELAQTFLTARHPNQPSGMSWGRASSFILNDSAIKPRKQQQHQSHTMNSPSLSSNDAPDNDFIFTVPSSSNVAPVPTIAVTRSSSEDSNQQQPSTTTDFALPPSVMSAHLNSGSANEYNVSMLESSFGYYHRPASISEPCPTTYVPEQHIMIELTDDHSLPSHGISAQHN